MSKHLVFALCLAFSMVLVGCANRQVKQSQTYRAVELTAGQFSVAWRSDTPLDNGEKLTEVFPFENVVVAYTNKSRAIHLSRSSGALISMTMVTDRPQHIFPPLLIGDRTVYATNTTLEIHDKDGRKIRSHQMKAPVRSAPVPANPTTKNLVYVAIDKADHGRIQLLDLDNPLAAVQWEIQTESNIASSPIQFNGTIYFAGMEGNVYAVTEERTPIWPTDRHLFVPGGRVLADLKIDAGGLYVASEDSKLYCVDPTKGKAKWQFYASKLLHHAPQATPGYIYLPVDGVGVICIDKLNGPFNRETKWICPSANGFLSEDELNAYLIRNETNGVKTLLVCDKATGKIKSQITRSDFSGIASNITDSIVFTTTSTGEVLALRPVMRSGGVGEVVESNVTAPNAKLTALP